MNARFAMFVLMIFLSLAAYAQSKPYSPSQQFTVEQLQKDFSYLRTKMEKSHPALYRYTPKPVMDAFFDSLYNSITTPQTEREFYNTITLLNGKIKDGHTMMLPGEESMAYANSNGGYLPFYFFISNDQLYVNMNCAVDTAIKEGDEIISINGKSASAIVDFLLERQIRDGATLTYPQWILNTYFKSYYAFAFGQIARFTINYKDKTGNDKTTVINALPNDSILYYRKLRYTSRLPATGEGQGIVLATISGTGVLTIKSFNNYFFQQEYKQNFKKELEKIFARLASDKTGSLILDLRNNQGGDWENGRLLLSYLIDKPLKYLQNSIESRQIEPAKNNYKGKLYVLINGGSFSNSAIVSSYLQQTGRGIFIGEESGGNKTIICGEPRDYTLPTTKIALQVSSGVYQITNNTNDGHGIIPDHIIHPTIENVVAGKDAVMEFAMNLVSKSQAK